MENNEETIQILEFTVKSKKSEIQNLQAKFAIKKDTEVDSDSDSQKASPSYSGNNVLEGFCSNTESLCNNNSDVLDHEFYKMCLEDNMMIFEIAQQETHNIPHMTLTNLKETLFKKLKLNKACDVYR